MCATTATGNGVFSSVVAVTQHSVDSTLSALTLSSGTLPPAFNSAITSYTANVANTVVTILVTATASNSNAGVSVTSAVALDAGTTTDIAVVVTPQSGDARTYTIVVTRAALPPLFLYRFTNSLTELTGLI